jgi:tetratricopeptide (TPR) repeat protein
MNKDKSLKDALDKIITKLNSGIDAFDECLEFELHSIDISENLEQLNPDDREILAKLFNRVGENQLKQGDSNVLKSFESAVKISNSFNIHYTQGLAYLRFTANVQCLILAKKCFEKALEINPKSFDALYAYCLSYVEHGVIIEDAAQFGRAIELFDEACALGCSNKEACDFYWNFGLAWFYLGKLSGEAIDFNYALDKYRQAATAGLNHELFWNAYGDAVIEMAFLVGKKEYFFEAIDMYQNSLRCNQTQFQGYFNLACAYQCVFEITVDNDYFEHANECFEKAALLDSERVDHFSTFWLKWGQLLSTYGKFKRDITYLELSLEKFIIADKIEPNHPGILSRWGEAEMLLGANTDQIHHLKGAEEKLVRSLGINSDAPENWYLYGICLNEHGRYFADENYYRLAIQKFQYGLSLTKTDPLLWYGLAMSNFALGDLLDDLELIEKSVRYCSQVMEFGGSMYLQFWNDWAVGLMRMSEMTLNPNYVDSAIQKFEEIIKRQTDGTLNEEIDLEWLYNYGCALDMKGDFTDDLNFYEKSVQVLANVVKLDPEYTHARYNLALALSHLGESISDVDCLQKASEHFQILLSEDAEDEIAWNDWGLCLLHQGELVYESCRPEVSKAIYEQAESKFFHALSLGCLPAFYNLACLYALMGNYKAAMHYMERAEVAGSLPPIEDIMHDEWLDNLRKTDSFKAFISALNLKQKRQSLN